VSPTQEGVSPQVSRGGSSRLARLAALGALALAVIAIAVIVLSGGDGGHKYRLVFETGGQLVKDNQVLIGGTPVGSIDSIELTDNGQAEVDITVDQELHEGTSAVIRSTSLSGVANRYISLTPGPNNAPELGDDALITQVDTTAPVDLDQLFNTFDDASRKGLQDIIVGSATTYAGRGPEANETYRYLSPALTATNRLINEINRDQRIFSDFLVDGARVVTAVAERRDDLSGLVSNGNEFLGAIAAENRSFDRALRAFPPALRQANTTFANLRPTLDDLDSLVDTAKPATKDLAPFLRQLKPVVRRSIPVFKDLRPAVNRKGKNNDLADAFAKLPSVQNAAARSVPPSIQAMIDSDPNISFIRPYTPDLVAALSKLGAVTGYYDADGRYARVQPAGLNVFTRLAGGNLQPIPANAVLTEYGAFGGTNADVFRRCPGGATQSSPDGSNPFVTPPALASGLSSPADCVSTDLPPGP
jgi:phospholipid/cholesterol/gamma-HCH transport system substrate-binding protein